ncbi:MAG: hypothetical protein EBT02_02290, partial [Planctomycetia bacterium]|nr:hypothetical protein [Planctomycetia bacterium]
LESDLRSHPDLWTRVKSGKIFASGRDPNYPGWPDTLQLNYFNPLRPNRIHFGRFRQPHFWQYRIV